VITPHAQKIVNYGLTFIFSYRKTPLKLNVLNHDFKGNYTTIYTTFLKNKLFNIIEK